MKSLLVTSTMTVKAVCSLLSSKMKLFDTSRFQFLCQFDQEKSNENNNNNNNNNNNSNEDKYLVTLSKDQILFDFIVNIDRDKKKYKFYFSEPNNLQIQQVLPPSLSPFPLLSLFPPFPLPSLPLLLL